MFPVIMQLNIKVITLLVIATVSFSLILTKYWVNRELKKQEQTRVTLREFTDVEKWKVFLLEEIQRNGFTYRDFALMSRTVACESSWRQYSKNGEVLVSKTNDIGLAQINKLAHKETYTKMNLDPNDPYDNLKYAIFLYKKSGLFPWRYSGACRNK